MVRMPSLSLISTGTVCLALAGVLQLISCVRGEYKEYELSVGIKEHNPLGDSPTQGDEEIRQAGVLAVAEDNLVCGSKQFKETLDLKGEKLFEEIKVLQTQFDGLQKRAGTFLQQQDLLKKKRNFEIEKLQEKIDAALNNQKVKADVSENDIKKTVMFPLVKDTVNILKKDIQKDTRLEKADELKGEVLDFLDKVLGKTTASKKSGKFSLFVEVEEFLQTFGNGAQAAEVSYLKRKINSLRVCSSDYYLNSDYLKDFSANMERYFVNNPGYAFPDGKTDEVCTYTLLGPDADHMEEATEKYDSQYQYCHQACNVLEEEAVRWQQARLKNSKTQKWSDKLVETKQEIAEITANIEECEAGKSLLLNIKEEVGRYTTQVFAKQGNLFSIQASIQKTQKSHDKVGKDLSDMEKTLSQLKGVVEELEGQHGEITNQIQKITVTQTELKVKIESHNTITRECTEKLSKVAKGHTALEEIKMAMYATVSSINEYSKKYVQYLMGFNLEEVDAKLAQASQTVETVQEFSASVETLTSTCSQSYELFHEETNESVSHWQKHKKICSMSQTALKVENQKTIATRVSEEVFEAAKKVRESARKEIQQLKELRDTSLAFKVKSQGSKAEDVSLEETRIWFGRTKFWNYLQRWVSDTGDIPPLYNVIVRLEESLQATLTSSQASAQKIQEQLSEYEEQVASLQAKIEVLIETKTARSSNMTKAETTMNSLTQQLQTHKKELETRNCEYEEGQRAMDKTLAEMKSKIDEAKHSMAKRGRPQRRA
eukprot:TRINITY_DN15507_c0_g2_i1.p1 TRINITY_DN15507_c0_g2~~TRINITY_DN15507_c0_g2_i1.p1  ORF type:complete len:806 (-),score=152.85 TRINITY_DN15507_c0_g2_i1:93-2405(-)